MINLIYLSIQKKIFFWNQQKTHTFKDFIKIIKFCESVFVCLVKNTQLLKIKKNKKNHYSYINKIVHDRFINQ